MFHLRMVKEEGFPPYLVVKPYYFKKEKEEGLVTDITFKKYLKINLNDSIRKVVGSNFTDADLTYDFPSNSGTKYKFRITSIKTGKKIDLNIDFSRRKVMNDGTTPDLGGQQVGALGGINISLEDKNKLDAENGLNQGIADDDINGAC